MDSREVIKELNMLTEDSGMNREEALNTLGLADGDPLLVDGPEELDQDGLTESSSSDNASAVENRRSHPADGVVEMFPHISRGVILRVWEEQNGDFAAVSDELLNYEVIENERREQNATDSRSASDRRRQKEMKRMQRKLQQQLSREETDIEFIAQQSNTTKHNARQLYWTHNNDVTQVLITKMPKQPIIPTSAAESILKAKSNDETVKTRTASPSSVTTLDGANKETAEEIASVEKYSKLPHRELRFMANELQLRIDTLIDTLRSMDRTKNHNSFRFSEATDTSREWRKERELMMLALHNANWLRKPDLTSNVSDSHGCTLEQAQILTKDAIYKFKHGQHNQLEIITGAGRHSTQGRPVSKPWLREYLRRQNLCMREKDGSFVVTQRTVN